MRSLPTSPGIVAITVLEHFKIMITKYNELPIGKYLELVKLLEEKRDDLDLQVGVVAVLTDLTEDEVLALSLSDYHTYAYGAKFLETEPKVTERVAKEYNLSYVDGDGKAKSICLIPCVDAKKMTTAQYIDFQNFNKEKGAQVELLSTLLVPKGCKYCEGYDPAEVQKAIRESMSVDAALSLLAFFFASLRGLTRVMLIYSKLMLKRKQKKTEREKALLKEVERLARGGAGRTQ